MPPMGRPTKRLLESNGHACRKKLTKTIDVPADGKETTSVKFVRYQYTVKKKQHVDIILYIRHHIVHLTEKTFDIP